jgi:hypothetical protein
MEESSEREMAQPLGQAFKRSLYDVACGQIDIGNALTELSAKLATGALQPNGEIRAEPTMDVKPVADAVLYSQPAARSERAVHHGSGEQGALRRPRLDRYIFKVLRPAPPRAS